MASSDPVQPKVFISYSHDSVEHENRVRNLADKLREDGIEAIVDQYVESPREGWPLWMQRQISEATHVLLICTDKYVRRVQGEEESPSGSRWEGHLIYQALCDSGANNTKFIPVLFDEGRPHLIPIPLRGVNYYRLDQESGYERLYRRITNQPHTPMPPIGYRKSMPPIEHARTLNNTEPQQVPGTTLGSYRNALLEEIQLIGEKYLPEEYVEREIDELGRAFLQSCNQVLLIVDGAGTGKTSFCCHLGLHAIDIRPVILLNCGYADNISELSHRLVSMRQGPNRVLGSPPPLVILDAINEFDRMPEMRRAIVKLVRGAPTAAEKYVITCRDVAWEYFSHDLNDSFLQKVLYRGVLTAGNFPSSDADRLFEKYFIRFGVTGEIRDRARSVLTHPLMLRIFCEAYQSEVVGRVTDVYLTSLFETYLSRKRAEIATRLRLAGPTAVDQFLENLADLLWRSQDDHPAESDLASLPYGGVDPLYGSLYASLLDTQILTEKATPTAPRRIGFQYEAFQDFITARMLRRKIVRSSRNSGAIIQQCAEYLKVEPRRPTLETVAGFLFAMIREEHENDECEFAEIAAEEPIWARSVIRALRQLPSSRITPSELSLLVSLSNDNDPDTLRLAMESVADRYAYLADDLRQQVSVWIDSGYPRLSARIIAENFLKFPETDWSALMRLLARDRSQIAHSFLLDFALGLVSQGDTSDELKTFIERLSGSADLQIRRTALRVLQESFCSQRDTT